MYTLLDIFFLLFHTGLMALNLLGWIWPKTRRANLIALALTAFSWLVIGPLFFQWGYCFLTDWHWDVLRELGETDLPNSYVKYLADRLTGLDWEAGLVDTITVVGMCAGVLGAVVVNVRDWRRKRAQSADF